MLLRIYFLMTNFLINSKCEKIRRDVSVKLLKQRRLHLQMIKVLTFDMAKEFSLNKCQQNQVN